MIKTEQREQGKEKMYGFSRYSHVMPLYQKTGAKIINQEQLENETRTYYYWYLI